MPKFEFTLVATRVLKNTRFPIRIRFTDTKTSISFFWKTDKKRKRIHFLIYRVRVRAFQSVRATVVSSGDLKFKGKKIRQKRFIEICRPENRWLIFEKSV